MQKRTLALVFLLLACRGFSQCNLLVNGNFEFPHQCPPIEFSNDFICQYSTGSLGSGRFGVGTQAKPFLHCSDTLGDHTTGYGNMLIGDAGTTDKRIWYAYVKVVAGQTYNFSAWARNNVPPNSCSNFNGNWRDPVLYLKIGGLNGTLIATSPNLVEGAGWVQFGNNWVAPTTATVELDVVAKGAPLIGSDFNLDDITFTVNDSAPTNNLTFRLERPCLAGQPAAIVAQGSTGIYNWYNNPDDLNPTFTGDSLPIALLNDSAVYYVRAQSQAGYCLSQPKRVVITPRDSIELFLPNDTTICYNSSLQITAGSATQGQYVWNTGQTGPDFNIKNQGKYVVTLTDTLLCTATDSITVQVAPLLFDTTKQYICPKGYALWLGDTIRSAGFYADTTPYTANTPVCDSVINVLQVLQLPTLADTNTLHLCHTDSFYFAGQWIKTPGTYTDTSTAQTTGCDSLFTIVATQTPLTTTQAKATLCATDSIVWGGQVITQAGTYYHTLTGQQGCDSVRQQLTVLQLPNYLFTLDTTVVNTYLVFDGNVLTDSGTHTFNYATLNGCDSVWQVRVHYTERFKVPNIITPNGDGLNDNFAPDLPVWRQNSLRIFNRWGQPIYTATNYRNNWPHNQAPKPGVYYYYLKSKSASTNHEHIYKGWLQIIY